MTSAIVKQFIPERPLEQTTKLYSHLITRNVVSQYVNFYPIDTMYFKSLIDGKSPSGCRDTAVCCFCGNPITELSYFMGRNDAL
jgi:hypothetical protein